MPSQVLGKVSVVPRGDYNASTAYTALDIVGYSGGSYMALKPVTGVTPGNDQVNWMQLSGPGLPGVDGTDGVTFTPSVSVEGIISWTNNGSEENPDPIDIMGPKGDPGAAAGFGTPTATVDNSTGTPAVEVEASGPDTAKVFNFAFSGLKGETGAKGDTGDKGDTGATGPQGVSVTGAEINESGRLIITLSAGEPIDAGNAVGPTGAKGDTGATGPEGASVSRIERTSGTGAPGTTDTYTVYLTDGSTGGTFQVYNGANGTGSGDFMADGSVPMSGALQMGGNRITNVGAPTADTDAVRQSDLKAVSDEVDKILDGTTPVAIPAATTAKIGGVIVGDGLSVETNGTISADSQLPEGGTNGQILTKTADGEAWANPPDTGVTMFNGRTGAVTPQAGDYTAAMVGARGDDWTPTADDVGAIPAPEGGTAGQVLTKTVDGEAWQDAPSGLPDGGTEGQMLYKSADGAEWGDEPVMYVNITGDDEATIADKTFSEITEAVQNGFTVYAKADTPEGTIVLPLSMQTEQSLFFTVLIETVLAVAVITEQHVVLDNIRLDATHIEFVPSSGITSDNVQDAIEEVQSNIPTDYIPTSEKGANSGIATLGADGVLTEGQRPTYTASDVGARPDTWTPTASDVGAATPADVNAAKPILRTATLTTSGWSGNSQTVTVNGVVANSSAQLIYVSPANKDSATAWGGAGVFCSAQGANSLTFVCDSVPSANISVNISIQEAQA